MAAALHAAALLSSVFVCCVNYSSQDARAQLAADWHSMLARCSTDAMCDAGVLSGSTPPSMFVGSYGYPRVYVGPMVPPVHGDTAIFDSPEGWGSLSLGEIVGLRLGMVRGVRQVRADAATGRYVEGLQEVAMSAAPAESEINLGGPLRGTDRAGARNLACDAANNADLQGGGTLGPFGPIGIVESVHFSGISSPARPIEKAYYDRDLPAADAMMALYESGIPMSGIQRCLSMGMLGMRRRLVPTKWSITAADSAISGMLLAGVLECDVIDSYKVFKYAHLGNVFSVVLFPHAWAFELVEGWHTFRAEPAMRGYDSRHAGRATAPASAQNEPVLRTAFGSDWEDARHLKRTPVNTAGAYHAARLGVLEYLEQNKVQSGVLVFREITPAYSVPVGVWQVREGVRAAMRSGLVIASDMHDAIARATSGTGIKKSDWLAHARMLHMMRQTTLEGYL